MPTGTQKLSRTKMIAVFELGQGANVTVDATGLININLDGNFYRCTADLNQLDTITPLLQSGSTIFIRNDTGGLMVVNETGNIVTPGGTDGLVTVSDGDMMQFIADGDASKWRMVVSGIWSWDNSLDIGLLKGGVNLTQVIGEAEQPESVKAVCIKTYTTAVPANETAGGIRLVPSLSGIAGTVTQLRLISLDNPQALGSVSITHAPALHFNAAAGTHKSVSAHSGGGTPTLGSANAPVTGEPDAWIKISVNGTLMYIPAWS